MQKVHWTKKYLYLLKEWHPSKNVGIIPTNCRQRDKVWWYLPYDDPATGKHFDFEWQATIDHRVRGAGCPFLSGQAMWPGYNDLASKHSDLAAQWHPTKNGNLTPEMVTCHSNKKVWWYLPYDDPESGKHFDFVWISTIADRIRGGECPFLSGRAVWLGYNDLASKYSDLAVQWHPTKNGNLTPEMVTCYSNKKVWWYLPYDDPETGKHFDFEWQAHISTRVRSSGCPFLSGVAWPGYNDLASKNGDLAAQWHPTKNGSLTPEMVTCYSDRKVWWYLPYDDPETGKHFDFEWVSTIANRIQGNDCPFLSGRAAWPGYNDLASKRSDLAAQWHPTKNGNLTPEMVTCHSDRKVWWYLPYDDPESGKHFDFVWISTIAGRVRGRECPFLSGRAVWPGYNDLASRHSDLAAQWHPTKNGSLTPEMATCNSEKRVWWYLPYDDPETGKHFDFEWQAYIANRVKVRGCPFLSGMAVWPGFNDLETCSNMIAEEWHHKKNKKKRPNQIYMYERKIKRWWICLKCGHEWRATVRARVVDGVTCPNCRRIRGDYR